jgi:hypothetical protein
MRMFRSLNTLATFDQAPVSSPLPSFSSLQGNRASSILRRYGLTSLAGIAIVLAGLSLPGSPLSAQNLLTPGQFQVTDAGAATYNIPLYSAPSAGGLDVKLSLQYNSQSPNGVFGVGWSLNGVSAITRCPKTPAEEGARIGVKNDASDVFCLDGQKLRMVAGSSYGAAGSEYRTALDSYSKIVANGSQGAGPQSFTVYTKAGAILEFGATDDSRLEHPGKANIVRVWMVSQMRDRFSTAANSNATAINFSYTKNLTLGEQLLQTVRHNNGQIKLVYEARPANDFILKYDDGIQLGSTQSRVNRIEIYDEPVVSAARQLRLFKQYRMGYLQSQVTKRSLITSVQECGATPSACLPAATLSYRQFDPTQFVDARAGATFYSQATYAADREGKGYSSIYSAYNLDQLFGGVTPIQGSGPSFGVWDVDGDGKAEIYADYQVGAGSDSPSMVSKVLYGNGTIVDESRNANRAYWVPGRLCHADINGDGVSETFIAETTQADNNWWGLVAGYYTNGAALPWFNLSTSSPENAWPPCQAADFDGDGRSELVFFGALKSFSWLPNNAWQESALVSSSIISKSTLGDFNGDGKTDILSWGGYRFDLQISNGTLFNGYATYQTPGTMYPAADAVGDQGPHRCSGDFFGDGRTRSLIAKSGVPTLTLFEFNGTGFTETPTNIPFHSYGYTCADFDGDGRTDVHINFTGRIWQSTTSGPADVLLQVNNGLGFIHKVDYKSITDPSIYTKYSGAVRPQVDVQTPIQVVSRVQAGNDAQGWNASNYRYEGLRADLHRRGTLGFAKVISTNELTGISVATSYHQRWPLTGMKSQVLKSRAGQSLESSSYSYLIRGYNGAAPTAQFSQVHLTQTLSLKNDLNGAFLDHERESILPTDIDSLGNPLKITSEELDAGGAITSRKTVQTSYSNNVATWLIGLPAGSSTRQENLRSLPATSAGTAPGANLQTGLMSVSINPSPANLTLPSAGTASLQLTSNVFGGAPPISYAWNKLTRDRIRLSAAGRGGEGNIIASVPLDWNASATDVVEVIATDASGRSASARTTVTFSSLPQLVFTASPANPLSAPRNSPGAHSIGASASASGGLAPYSYSWSKLNGSRISIANPTSPAASFNASLGWSENLSEAARITITDAAGNQVSRDFTVNFTTPAQLAASITPSPVIAGACAAPSSFSTVITASASGGVGPYTFTWSANGNAYIFSPSGNSVTVGFASSEWEDYSNSILWGGYVYVTVRDAAGNQVVQSVRLGLQQTGSYCPGDTGN